VTLDEAFRRHRAGLVRRSRPYRRAEARRLLRFAAFCRSRGAKKVHDVTVVDVLHYHRWLRTQGLSEAGIRRHVAAVWRWVRFLAKAGPPAAGKRNTGTKAGQGPKTHERPANKG